MLEGQPGVYRYDGETLTYLAFPLPAVRDSAGGYKVTGMARGKSGKLWIGTYQAVIGYDGESFTIIDHESLGVEERGRLGIRCVLEDSKGNLWIGSNGLGVFLHDGETNINFTEEHGLGKRDAGDESASLHQVFSIGEDRAGDIWFGTLGYGAWRYDGESLRNFTEEDGLTSKQISAIYVDRQGDLWLGGGFVIHENLGSRLTEAAVGFDVLMPTGDPAQLTGFDRWILQPVALLVFNPTDLFPVFFIGRYQHSVADGDELEPLRTINLSFQTFHILPNQFFLLFIPNLIVDLNRDQTVFTFGIGAGRAMSRRLALQASYVQYILGSETFSRGFQLGFSYFWGPNRGL